MTATRKYKATFILDTRNYEQPVETLEERLKEVISSQGGTVSEVKSLGQIDFARVTDRHHTGDIYLEFFFEGPAASPAGITEGVRLDTNVKRVLVESAD